MLEFGKQLIELADENASNVEYFETSPLGESILSSILNTINQVELNEI